MDTTALLVALPAVLAAIVFHEYAHARVAYALGDPTARLEGRMTLNPMKHFDWLGLLMFWLVHWGWARPVPVNPRYFRNPERDMALVAAAGPAANLVLAIVALALLQRTGLGAGGVVTQVLEAGVWYNIWLAAFNLLPIPPLDGSKILAMFLPPDAARAYLFLETYGWLILMLLVFLGWVSAIISPISLALFHFVSWMVGVWP